jgi:hypothetical protein
MFNSELHPIGDNVHDGGLNEHDTPDGKLAQLKLTGCWLPTSRADVTIVVAFCPIITVLESGLTSIEKAKGGVHGVVVQIGPGQQ